MQQQIATFLQLFPIIRDGGVFLCEDSHSSYFPDHGGGLKKEDTFHEFVKCLIDKMHAWYHAPLSQIDSKYYAHHIYNISIYDSIVVIEKRSKNPPQIFSRAYEGNGNNPLLRTWLEMRRASGVADE